MHTHTLLTSTPGALASRRLARHRASSHPCTHTYHPLIPTHPCPPINQTRNTHTHTHTCTHARTHPPDLNAGCTRFSSSRSSPSFHPSLHPHIPPTHTHSPIPTNQPYTHMHTHTHMPTNQPYKHTHHHHHHHPPDLNAGCTRFSSSRSSPSFQPSSIFCFAQT